MTKSAFTPLAMACAFSAFMALSMPAAAQTTAAATTSAAADLNWTQGVVRRVDTTTGKVSLKHEEIKNLDMPPMTMVFKATTPSQLASLKVGDTVRFVADDVDGVLIVTHIEAKP